MMPWKTAGEIEREIDSFVYAFSEDFEELDFLHVFVVMDSAFMFAADVVRKLWACGVETKIHFIKGTADPYPAIFPGEHVLVIEDIVDTGETLGSITKKIMAFPGEKSLVTAVLVNKPNSRKEGWDWVQPDYSCFELDNNDWVVGYGMDLHGEFRDQPFLSLIPSKES